MNPDPQPGLFDRNEPREVEVSGYELAEKIKELESKGAVILGMATVTGWPAKWKLQMFWPK